MDIKDIFKKNVEWTNKKLKENPDYFKQLSRAQTPNILYIGCADSRVKAEEILGVDSGVVFVHRNIANMVPNTDLSAMSVINYAVTHLEVEHIVVCGHYDCGGIHAAMKSSDLGILNSWLRNIRDVYRLHQKELDSIMDEQQKHNRLVELNVQEQCINVIKAADVQKAYNNRNINVHGWVFDLKTGKLIDLKIDFEKILKDIMKIYRLS